jgi:branched-subunit amino acid transport protein
VEKLLIFAAMALATYFTRYTLIAILGREVPPLLRRWLRHVPVAVLAALVAPAALAPQGRLEIGLHAWAVLAGAAVAWRTRSVLWTIVGGLGAFWLLRMVGAPPVE